MTETYNRALTACLEVRAGLGGCDDLTLIRAPELAPAPARPGGGE